MKENKIIEKMSNSKLSYEEISYMVNGYVNGSINDKTMTKFIMNIYNNGFSKEEIFYLTDIMVKSGEVVDLSKIEKPLVDKHSTGGIGDKISIIIAPIVASLGVVVPKMSGRGLGLTGGTVDKLESIKNYKLDLTREEFIDALNKVGCAVISQSENLAIADKKIYALRNEIKAVDSIPLIASSIMSKKIASGADNIVIDLKVGLGAFMKNKKSATKLAKTMIDIANYYDKKLVCVLSDMNCPLGEYVGNKLEIIEAINFFDGKYEKRLYNLVIYLATTMVMIATNKPFKSCKLLVKETIKNGNAKKKFYEWISYQKGEIEKLKIDAKKYIVLSDEEGYINNIDANIIGKLVFDLGAGRKKKTDKIDYNVGVYINKTLGNKIKKNEILGIIYYNKEIENMQEIFKSAFKINKNKKRVHNIIIKTIK